MKQWRINSVRIQLPETKDLLAELVDDCVDENAIVFLELELLRESMGIRETSREGHTISQMMQRIERESHRLKEIENIIASETGNEDNISVKSNSDVDTLM